MRRRGGAGRPSPQPDTHPAGPEPTCGVHGAPQKSPQLSRSQVVGRDRENAHEEGVARTPRAHGRSATGAAPGSTFRGRPDRSRAAGRFSESRSAGKLTAHQVVEQESACAVVARALLFAAAVLDPIVRSCRERCHRGDSAQGGPAFPRFRPAPGEPLTGAQSGQDRQLRRGRSCVRLAAPCGHTALWHLERVARSCTAAQELGRRPARWCEFLGCHAVDPVNLDVKLLMWIRLLAGEPMRTGHWLARALALLASRRDKL